MGLLLVHPAQERARHAQNSPALANNSQDFSRRAELRVACAPLSWAAGPERNEPGVTARMCLSLVRLAWGGTCGVRLASADLYLEGERVHERFFSTCVWPDGLHSVPGALCKTVTGDVVQLLAHNDKGMGIERRCPALYDARRRR